MFVRVFLSTDARELLHLCLCFAVPSAWVGVKTHSFQCFLPRESESTCHQEARLSPSLALLLRFHWIGMAG